jgi:deoxyribonuclease V
VAKSILVGTHDEVGPQRGDRQPLEYKGEVIGCVLRSKDRIRPLIISPGHRVSMATAPELVLAFGTKYRLPEPTRLADKLASQRGTVRR